MTVSQLVLGAMNFGTRIDEATSFALLDRFVDAGGEWIDTADAYSFWASGTGFGGQSEELLGRWLASRPHQRDRVKIATKVGAEPLARGPWPESREGLSAQAITTAFAGSLARLQTDHVEMLWGHMEDRRVPIEETTDAMGALVASGVVARIGLSNHPAWRVERACGRALARGTEPFTAVQLSRSYLRPRPGVLPAGMNHRFGVMSDEQVDHATSNGLDIWAYSPSLSGAYDNPAKAFPEAFDHPGNTARLAALDSVAAELGVTRGQVVFAWMVGGSPVIHPMLGGSSL